MILRRHFSNPVALKPIGFSSGSRRYPEATCREGTFDDREKPTEAKWFPISARDELGVLENPFVEVTFQCPLVVAMPDGFLFDAEIHGGSFVRDREHDFVSRVAAEKFHVGLR
jgi:hypothetical protein